MEFTKMVNVDVISIAFNMVNFLILFFIIKHFFYEKINDFMKKRSDDIALEIKDAEMLKIEAEGYKEEYFDKLSKVEEQSKEIIKDATNQAKERKNQIIEEAKQEAERVQNRAKVKIDLEKKKALEEVKVNIVDLTLYATEKVIKETLDKEKHEELILGIIQEVGEVK